MTCTPGSKNWAGHEKPLHTGRRPRTHEQPRGTRTPSGRSGRQSAGTSEHGNVHLYTLDVFLPRRPAGRSFLKSKSGVSRLIQIRGDQTLEDLHNTIFSAFDREEEHMYEFQLGQGPKDLLGPTYGPDGIEIDQSGAASETTIDSLRLKVGRSFGYLFDFGDNWWHQINVTAVENVVTDGTFPRVTKRVGRSPPQYPEDEDAV